MRRLEKTVLGLLALAVSLAVWQSSFNYQATALIGGLLLFLVPIVALPLVFYVLFRFAYRMFVRPYLRFWRMRRYRSNKELVDAVRRGQ